MDERTLIEQYPRIYHMAEGGSWPLILRHGLLSTSTLLGLLECPTEQRQQIEARHRPQKVQLSHPDLGSVVIRDQKPMSDSALRKILTDGTPEDWYRLLNSKVFFWATHARLTMFLGARAYRDSDQIVITVDTEQLVGEYRESIHLSPINSGATLYNPVPRGADTFLRIADYPFVRWKQRRSSSEAVAEIAVAGGVANITRYAVEVRRWRGNSPGELVWTPSQSPEKRVVSQSCRI